MTVIKKKLLKPISKSDERKLLVKKKKSLNRIRTLSGHKSELKGRGNGNRKENYKAKVGKSKRHTKDRNTSNGENDRKLGKCSPFKKCRKSYNGKYVKTDMGERSRYKKDGKANKRKNGKKKVGKGTRYGRGSKIKKDKSEENNGLKGYFVELKKQISRTKIERDRNSIENQLKKLKAELKKSKYQGKEGNNIRKSNGMMSEEELKRLIAKLEKVERKLSKAKKRRNVIKKKIASMTGKTGYDIDLFLKKRKRTKERNKWLSY